MNSILKTLSICICLILPLTVNADDCSDMYNTQGDCAQSDYHNGVCMWNDSACVERCPSNQDSDGCASYDGCGYVAGSCSPCDATHWNSQDRYNTDTTNNKTCTLVGNGYFRNNDGTGQIQCPNSNGTVSSPEEQTYIGSCSCNGNSILIHTQTTTNTHSYYCGNCGDGSADNGSNSVSQGSVHECICATGANRVHGEGNVECDCPDTATWSGGQPGTCTCLPGNYTPQGSDATGYACCPGKSTYNSTSNKCECNITYAQKTYDNNDILTQCECVAGHLSDDKSKCVCDPNQIVTFGRNNLGQFLSLCTSCTDANSYPDTQEYPRFCKCNSGYYQEAPSSTSNPTPTCHKCPTQTQTPLPGSVGPESCRLKYDTKFLISNTHTRYMELIPQGATILPIYTDPYVQNNNNAQSQYTH